METNTLANAARQALLWCAAHPGWVRACDVPDTRIHFLQWAELSAFARTAWADEQEYDRFATKECKVRHGFIASNGEFFEDVTRIPESLRLEPVFFVGLKSVRSRRRAPVQAAASVAEVRTLSM